MSRPPTLDLPDGTTAYRLSTARGGFAVHDTGERPRGTVLLVPGFTGSKEDFIGLLAPLAAAGYRAVAVDGRGQYETGGPREESVYAQVELASDVLAQADALGGRPHLLGHSLGGLVSRAAALREPDRFRSLTLLSSGPGPVCPAQQARVKMLLGALPVMDMEAVWQAMRELDPSPGFAGETPLSAADEATPAAVTDFLHRRWLANVPEQLIETGRQLITEPDRTAELAELTRGGLPLHVVSGERDYAWPVPDLDALAAGTGARRTVIAGAEHSPNADRPLQTAAALTAAWE